MGQQRTNRPWATSLAVALSTMILVLTSAHGQDPPPPPAPTAKAPAGKATKPSAGKSKTGRRGSRLVPGGPAAKAKAAADPLGKANGKDDGSLKAAIEAGTYHYKFKMALAEGLGTMSATYYPSRLGTGSAVVMMVHERDRSGKDFQDPIADLQGKSLAAHLQKLGIAVLTVDLRGQGENTRKATTSRDWRQMPGDLQTAYIFLLDRHNRGELNIGRLGVVGIGEGANLAVNWAATPGAAVAGEGRTTDLASLVLISPMIDANAQGLPAQRALTALASKVPIALLAGERDALSAELVKTVQAAMKRYRTNTVTFYPSSLHGYKLLKLEPEITAAIVRFLEDTVKARAEEWEPRYNLTPVTYSDVKTIANPKTADDPAETPKKEEKKEATKDAAK